jgi:hypothetical protein
MIQEVDAVFRDGVFVPEGPCPIPNQARVRLIVQAPGLEPPQLEDPADRQAALQQMIERMKQSSVSPAAFPVSREELHERR